jgi:hypothetical protein
MARSRSRHTSWRAAEAAATLRAAAPPTSRRSSSPGCEGRETIDEDDLTALLDLE